MRILLTGASGFIGSHVLLLLARKQPDQVLVNLDKLEQCACNANLDSLTKHPNYTFIEGSINDANLVKYILQSFQINVILNFAAQTHVDNSFGNSLHFTETNVLGTHTLLECARMVQSQIQKFVHVSTDEVYGHGLDGIASHEGSPMEPTNPYAASKAAAEHLVKAYKTSFGMPIIITRGNNVQGPHQQPEKIVPKFIKLCLQNKPLTIQGNGSNLRNYLYVEDVARAFDIILHKGHVNEIQNIGGTHEMSNLEVAKAIQEAMKTPLGIEYIPDRPFNDFRQPLTADKLKALGWTEQETFASGLSKTIAWYTKYMHRQST